MNPVVAVLLTLIAMSFVCDLAHEAALKRAQKVGFVVIDTNAYRLVPVQ